jgi:hypothetical protein
MAVGSNQYRFRRKGLLSRHQTAGLNTGPELKARREIFVLACMMTVVCTYFASRAQLDRHMDWLKGEVTLQAHAEVHNWTQPELAPLPERQRNAQLIRYYFGRDADQAIRVFTCESGLRTLAENDHNADGFPDIGIAQIHVTPSHPFTADEMKNPVANLLQAKKLFDDRGWQPWDSSRHCWSK